MTHTMAFRKSERSNPYENEKNFETQKSSGNFILVNKIFIRKARSVFQGFNDSLRSESLL